MITNEQSHDVPAIFTIFGMTGDLAFKKIIPSLWHLHQEHRLPKRLAIIGFARRDLSEADFRHILRSAIETANKMTITDEDFKDFLGLFSYQASTFEDVAGFASLATRISDQEKSWGVCASKLFYLAVQPSSYAHIFENLSQVKLNIPCGDELGWSRILIEKPFGHDLSSARELQALLEKYFKESQVYRIDHYLFKEIVQGIQNFRFSNNLFEKKWGKDTVERIDVRLHETVGVESRGSFYDGVGALRDVGQNHLPMMLAAVTAEYPPEADAHSIRKTRVDILSTLVPWTENMVRTQTFRAQYDGYQHIEGVKQSSQIETYYALQTELNHPRWSGVPIYMDAGKRLGESRKEIILTLKHPENCLLCKVGKHGPNRIIFRLEPNDEIIISFWTKKPGFEHELEERDISFFLYEKRTKIQYVEEYAKVINAAIRGEQSFFTSAEEVEALWRFIDPVIEGWARGMIPLESYAPDSNPAPSLLASTPDNETMGPEKGSIGFIGLGKMGANLARQVSEKGWHVVGFNRDPQATKVLEREGVIGAYTLMDLVNKLPPKRTIWLMVPHTAVDSVIEELIPLLSEGDTIIDGGNSPFKESIRHHQSLALRGISFLDVGVSGGPGGARNGACLMVGGDRALFERNEKLFKDMSVPQGYGYMGRAGAGHFVKMVHNGIEYGMMESIAEGFTILHNSGFGLSLRAVAELYQKQSVVTSRLIGWLKQGFDTYGEDLAPVSGSAGASGEGQWTIDAAKELNVDVASIQHALDARVLSQTQPGFSGKLIQTMRNMFGGHTESYDIRS